MRIDMQTTLCIVTGRSMRRRCLAGLTASVAIYIPIDINACWILSQCKAQLIFTLLFHEMMKAGSCISFRMTVLQTGQLPEEMVPDDNDNLEDMSDDDDRDRDSASPHLCGVSLPLRFGSLTGRYCCVNLSKLCSSRTGIHTAVARSINL